MGRLEDLRINAYLSEVARGYRNNELIAHNLFPTIESELEKIDIFEFNKEAFKVHDTERAIRANSNVISPEGFTKHSATLTEHDLAYPIDYREENEAKKVKLQIHATNVVTQGLQLKHEKQCADLAQDPNSYSSDNKIIKLDQIFIRGYLTLSNPRQSLFPTGCQLRIEQWFNRSTYNLIYQFTKQCRCNNLSLIIN